MLHLHSPEGGKEGEKSLERRKNLHTHTCFSLWCDSRNSPLNNPSSPFPHSQNTLILLLLPKGIEQAQATYLSKQNHVHGQHCGFCLWRRPALPAPPPPEAGGTPPGTGGAQPALDGIIIGIKTSAARFEHKKNLFFRTSKYRRVNSN